jgi:hypothetical protein
MARHAKPGDGESPETLPVATLTTILAAVASGDQSRAESNAGLN